MEESTNVHKGTAQSCSMLDEEGATTFFNHVLTIWINPEIERRSKDGKLADHFELWAAQLLFFTDGRPNIVRLNEEVRAKITAVASRAIQVNEVFPLEDGIKDIKNIELPENEDPNAGHLTLIKLKEHWYIVFDFRYNKKMAAERLDAAKQFLNASKMNYEQQLWRPFVENTFAATELLATGQLLLHADKAYTKNQAHEGTKNRYVAFVDMGNYEVEYKDTLLELRKLRKSARYVEKEFGFTKEEADKYLKVVEDMIEFTKKLLA